MKRTKFCRYCATEKALEDFAGRKASPDGLAYKCRACDRQYRAGRSDEYAALRRASYEKNRDAEKKAAIAYYRANRDTQKARHLAYMHRTTEQQKRYARENSARYAAHVAARRASLEQRTPAWLTPEDFAQMTRIYKLAKRLTELTGVDHEVDHELPLRGKKVSGLHVPQNLRVITASANSAKRNTYEPS